MAAHTQISRGLTPSPVDSIPPSPRPRVRAALTSWSVVGVLVTATLLAPVPALAVPETTDGTPAADRTSELEATRVDQVPTPDLSWVTCTEEIEAALGMPGALDHEVECATALLPQDYDDPRGPQVEIALARVVAADPEQRIGSLFLNPGGPGGSGVQLAAIAPYLFGKEVLDHFDVVGMDPRGIGDSTQVVCFPDTETQREAVRWFPLAVPSDEEDTRTAVEAARTIGRSCSTTGSPISASMSTAEVARDLDVLRRAVGDQKLTFYGASYGSILGQVYANMFPDRVRALAIDGVIDIRNWTGSDPTAPELVTDRVRSGLADSLALKEIFARCTEAGPERCPLAAEDPQASFDLLVERLRTRPVSLDIPDGETLGIPDGEPLEVGYPELVTGLIASLYHPYLIETIGWLIPALLDLSDPTGYPQDRTESEQIVLQWAELLAAGAPTVEDVYFNYPDAMASVMCTDGRHPADAGSWPEYAAAADRHAPHFGGAWAWWTAPCATSTWTARDEDAFHGPFDRRTSAPVLVIGNHWDPATPYWEAESVAGLLPNSRLLSSDNWGHTAYLYQTSSCVVEATDAYLVSLELPAEGTTCHGDYQPFTAALDSSPADLTGQGEDPALSAVLRWPVPPISAEDPARP